MDTNLFEARDMPTTEKSNLHRRALGERLPEMLNLIERLVNIDSGSYYKAGVDAVSGIMAEQLSSLGFKIERQPMPSCGDQIVGLKRMGGKGRVLILGHADTVWPEGTVQEWPFSMLGDRATGPGVGDMKGGLVMALFALQQLFETGFDDLESIRFFVVPDEELGSVHSRPQIEAAAREADWTLVLEPGRPGGGIVTARGALGAFFLHAHGQSAHCAVNYRKGASAVRELALKVAPLEALSEPDVGSIINVGVFNGGTAKQVVPGEARIDIDLRAQTELNAQALLGGIQRIAAKIDNPRVKVEVTGRFTRPVFTAERNRALSELAKVVAREINLHIFEVDPTGGGSDGNFAAALGVPTLDGLGPVCEEVCSRAESIDIPSLVDRGALFCGIIQRLATTKGI